MVVVGLAGRNCSGKDAVAEVLAEHGFQRLSLSDVLRQELVRRGRPITREALIEVGVELRRACGPAVLAERVRALMRGERVVVVSVRSPAEVAALSRLPGFVLWAVEAPVALRFERELRRRDQRGESAPPDLAAFVALEERENGADPDAQQMDATIALATRRLANDGTPAALRARVLALLEEFGG